MQWNSFKESSNNHHTLSHRKTTRLNTSRLFVWMVAPVHVPTWHKRENPRQVHQGTPKKNRIWTWLGSAVGAANLGFKVGTVRSWTCTHALHAHAMRPVFAWVFSISIVEMLPTWFEMPSDRIFFGFPAKERKIEISNHHGQWHT